MAATATAANRYLRMWFTPFSALDWRTPKLLGVPKGFTAASAGKGFTRKLLHKGNSMHWLDLGMRPAASIGWTF